MNINTAHLNSSVAYSCVTLRTRAVAIGAPPDTWHLTEATSPRPSAPLTWITDIRAPRSSQTRTKTRPTGVWRSLLEVERTLVNVKAKTRWEMICRKDVETMPMSLKSRFQHHYCVYFDKIVMSWNWHFSDIDIVSTYFRHLFDKSLLTWDPSKLFWSFFGLPSPFCFWVPLPVLCETQVTGNSPD